VIQKLLDGDDDILATLRKQSEAAVVVQREMTGVGFYTTFSIPDSIDRLPDNRSFQFGDVVADMPGLEHGAGFLLFVKDGALDFLEAYTYDEPWPEHVSTFELTYATPGQRDLKALHAV
jgi:hypothetical protein